MGEDALWMLVVRVARHWRRMIDQELSGVDLSLALCWPLLILFHEKRELRMSVLADAVGIEGPSLVRTVDMLVGEGLVSRHADPADKRARLLRLTPLGESRMPLMLEVLSVSRQRFMAAMQPEELEIMLRGLERMDRLLVGGAGLPLTQPDESG